VIGVIGVGVGTIDTVYKGEGYRLEGASRAGSEMGLVGAEAGIRTGAGVGSTKSNNNILILMLSCNICLKFDNN
jgi:hypothetical protein